MLFKQCLNGLGAHLSDELITVLFEPRKILFFSQKLAHFKFGQARIEMTT